MEIRKAIYGLPQAGALANNILKKRLAPARYYEMPHTPVLWKHVSHPIAFTLVMDDFSVKYVGKKNDDHFVSALKRKYKISKDWTGRLYCGIDLECNYMACTLDLVMPGYIKTQIQRYKHRKPTRPQHSLHPVAPRRYIKSAHHPIPPNETPATGPDSILRVQQVVGSILYYARAVDLTALTALTTLGSEQAKATAHTLKSTEHLLGYLATHPNAKL